MDVKSTFLNGIIEEELYVRQPPSFENPFIKDHVFKLKKDLYGLKKALRAWFKRLSNFLINNGFMRGNVDTILFRKNFGTNFIVVQIYVVNVIFGATNESLCENFSKLMHMKFEMRMMGELKFFLRV
uniref:Retrovirus-related Pol polyprotein from transposon TNT 1-94 n=1 Tax=Cajanus cajan TaxID=3821 RepID=A0A151SWV2_CAJCA|nr:Retrovirus-related Pol polyprotein from transposon TNT 1-94 [Cajanus cajan]